MRLWTTLIILAALSFTSLILLGFILVVNFCPDLKCGSIQPGVPWGPP